MVLPFAPFEFQLLMFTIGSGVSLEVAMHGVRRSSTLSAAIISVFLLTPGMGSAQVQSGRIVGTVSDQNKAVIPSADVVVTNVATNAVQKATTSAQGDYVITPVDPGTYNISVSATGFKKM